MNTNMPRRWMRSMVLGAVLSVSGLAALGLPSDAFAQTNPNAKKKEELVAPTPPTPKSGGMNLGQLGLAIVMLGVVGGVSLIPSKRGHQD